MTNALEIGKLLRSSITGCVVGCRASQMEVPAFGAMLRVPLAGDMTIFGLIYDIHVDDDGLVRQLATAENIAPEVILDNRLNRNVPVEISVLFIGYQLNGALMHLLPPRPPLALDAIYPCTAAEVAGFTRAGRFGYLRHILRAEELPVGELLAAHLLQAGQAHALAGEESWQDQAIQELIILLRDDYPTLMSVLSTLSEIKEQA